LTLRKFRVFVLSIHLRRSAFKNFVRAWEFIQKNYIIYSD
jgi:hypothetical protein